MQQEDTLPAADPSFGFTDNKPRPDWGLFGLQKRFLNIYIESTLHCPNHCSFCIYRTIRPSGTMPIEDLAAILPKLAGRADNIYVSCAGESLMLDDLPERVALVRAHCPDAAICLTTSLCVPRSSAYFRSLIAAGLSFMQISCYAHSREDYSKIHGRDAYETVKENLRLLGALKRTMPLHLQLDLLNDMGAHFGIAKADHKRAVFERFAREHGVGHILRKEVFTNQGRSVINGVPAAKAAPFPCSVLWGNRASYTSITWDLNVIACAYLRDPDHSLGNLRNTTLEDIYRSSRFASLYRKLWQRDLAGLSMCEHCDQPNHLPSRGEMMRLTAYEAHRLAGKKVFFWGCGEAYRQYAPLFDRTIPLAILYDAPGPCPSTVDGIPVIHPAIALKENSSPPIIIFAFPENSRVILNTIRTHYPHVTEKRIILCTPVLDDWYSP